MKDRRIPHSFKDFFHDIFIGVIIALVSIPISMGYASVAGLPVVYGLYGSLLPILFFGLITSSKRAVFGVDAAPAALVGGMLASMEIVAESAEALQVIPVVTLLTACWLFVFFLIKADRVLKFISKPVMGGFITGIGTTIILMQVPKLFGGVSGQGEVVELLIHIVKEAGDFNAPSFILGCGTIAIILICRHFCPKLPVHPILMFAGAVLSYFFFPTLSAWGVKNLPSVEPGLPPLVLPHLTILHGQFAEFILPSLSIAVVILSETLLATTNFAHKHGEQLQNRREILAYAAGNLVAAFGGCCPVNGSVSRTGIASQLGVTSQLMSVTASLVMGAILLFGTGFIAYLPVPVLTGIVISALIGTLEFSLAHKLKRADHMEFLIFYVAFFAVLFLGTIYGVLAGFLLATITFISRQSKPATDFLGIIPGLKGYYSLTNKNSQARPLKGLVLYRFSAPLFYANVSQFCQEILGAVGVAPEGASGAERVRAVVVDASGISSVDATAAERLVELYEELAAAGVDFYMAGHVSAVNEQLRDFGAGILIEKRVVRSRILYALCDAGFEPPFTEDLAASGRRNYPSHLAEFDWAFGRDNRFKKLHPKEASLLELQFERYFEELAMRNPELAKELADIIAEEEMTNDPKLE